MRRSDLAFPAYYRRPERGPCITKMDITSTAFGVTINLLLAWALSAFIARAEHVYVREDYILSESMPIGRKAPSPVLITKSPHL